jgi:WD40 repeat protein
MEGAMRFLVTGTGAVVVLLVSLGTAFAPPILGGFNPPEMRGARFSGDGRLVVVQFLSTSISSVGGNLTATVIYDTVTGKRLAEVPGNVLAIHPDNSRLLLVRAAQDNKGYSAEELCLWEWKTGKVLRAFEPTTDDVVNLTFSPDGKLVFSGHWDKYFRVWDVATGKQVRAIDSGPDKISKTTNNFPRFFFIDQGQRVVASYPQTMRVWDVASGEQVGPEVRVPDKLKGFSSHDLFSVSGNGQDAWLLLNHSIGWTSKGGPIVKPLALGQWGFRNDKLVCEIILPEKHAFVIGTGCSADNGRKLMAVADPGWLYTWEVPGGKLLWSMAIFPPAAQKQMNMGAVAIFSPGGRYLLTRHTGKTMRLWDTVQRKLLWTADIDGTK